LLFSSSSSYSCSLSLCLLLQRLQKLCNNKRHKEQQPAAATTATHTRLGEIKDPWNTTLERTYTVHRRTDDGGRETRVEPGCSFLAAFGSRFYRGKLVNFVPPRPPASFRFPPSAAVRLLSYYLVFLLFVNLLRYLRAVVCVGHCFHFSPPTSSFPPPSPLFPSVYEKLTSIITVQYRTNVHNTRNYYGFLNTTHSRIIRFHILCKKFI
jgi:hypothetical protein